MVIEGTLAVWLNVIAIAIITFAVSNFAVSVAVSMLAQRFVNFEVNSRKATLWLLATVPWMAVVCVVVCFLYQYHTYSIFVSDGHVTHWHHMTSFELASWHFATIVAAVAFVLYVLSRKLFDLYKHSNELNLLQSLSKQVRPDFFEVNSSKASAFTCGFINKKCYVTTGMLNNTTQVEQDVIFKHEKAHAELNDPFKKWLFSIFASFFVTPIAKRLVLHMTLAMEQAADREVLRQDIPATTVASTLVKVAKLNFQSEKESLINSTLVNNFGADVIEQRVHFLLGQLDLKPANKWLTILFISLTLGVCILSIDGIHHLMEIVFSH